MTSSGSAPLRGLLASIYDGSDGVVEEINVEQPGDFKVSSAEHMLGQL